MRVIKFIEILQELPPDIEMMDLNIVAWTKDIDIGVEKV